ncbi:GNAT family N-acetyltransferase [Brachybacterium sp. YJGR34]|uniref:GNAT family N-acetyltransferase n=1 Tax=Brachybacterium sp. YJGR34 TaxID=2059911 RepID=UPI000E09EDA6|nr:GNAT family N-acetyltransferase [Brachybacterium sp. YJGR34]
MIEVRRIDPESWRSWRALRLRALEESPWAFGSTLEEVLARDTETRWRESLAPPMTSFLVVVDGEALGMGRIMLPSAPEEPAELISVWVAPAARGRGAGRALVTAAVDHLAAHRPGLPLRLAVREDNAPARALYSGCGFRPLGPSAEDPTEILMEHAAPRPRDIRPGTAANR